MENRITEVLDLDYNTQQDPLIIAEYGRNVQKMVQHCMAIENRDERNICAKEIIKIMATLNPLQKDMPDYQHKLWDHLFVISNFKLDVDSPYSIPSPETFDTKPDRVPYPHHRIKYKQYGKILEDILKKGHEYEPGAEKDELTRLLANQLKKFYLNYNRDSVNDEVILNHLKELSAGGFILEDESKLYSTRDLKNIVRGPSNTNSFKEQKSNINNLHLTAGTGVSTGGNNAKKKKKFKKRK